MVALVGGLADNSSVLAINPAAGFVFSVLTVWIAWKPK
jgi:hypothetical protein